MKIYFAGSIRGGRDDAHFYIQIIELLANYGSVLTEHIGNQTLSGLGEETVTDQFIFERDVNWIQEADVIVAEVTNPSLGVGYELGISEKLGKKIICLYRLQDGKRLSAMVAGNDKFIVENYTALEDLKVVFDKNLKS